MQHQQKRGVSLDSWVELEAGALYFTPMRYLPKVTSDAFSVTVDPVMFTSATQASETCCTTTPTTPPSSTLTSPTPQQQHRQQPHQEDEEGGTEGANQSDFRFFSLDEHISYESLNADFGPAGLGCYVRAFRTLKREYDLASSSSSSSTKENEQRRRTPLVVICGSSCYAVHNAAAIVASFAVVVLGLDSTAIKGAFDDALARGGVLPNLLPFRDSALGASTFDMTLHDIVDAWVLARRHRWFLDWRTFDVEEYETMGHVDVADAHVIVPGLFVAFSSPDDRDPSRSCTRLLPHFSRHCVRLVVRLCEPLYADTDFIRHGLQCASLPFADGGVPTDAVVRGFFDKCNTIFDHYACGPAEEEVAKSEAQQRKERNDALLFRHLKKTGPPGRDDGAGGGAAASSSQQQQQKGRQIKQVKGCVAVHCVAGLGRTATMIALYCMHKYRCRAREVIAWLRLCRPGSVLGVQQHYLVSMESRLLVTHLSCTPPSNLLPKVAPRTRQGSSVLELLAEIHAREEQEKEQLVIRSSTSTKKDNKNDINKAAGGSVGGGWRSGAATPSVIFSRHAAAANALLQIPRPSTGSLARRSQQQPTASQLQQQQHAPMHQNFEDTSSTLPQLHVQSALSSFHNATTTTNVSSSQQQQQQQQEQVRPSLGTRTATPVLSASCLFRRSSSASSAASRRRAANNTSALANKSNPPPPAAIRQIQQQQQLEEEQRRARQGEEQQRQRGGGGASFNDNKSNSMMNNSTKRSAVLIPATCPSAPFSGPVPWSSPLTPTAMNEPKRAAYRTMAAAVTAKSRVMPRMLRTPVTRVYGSAGTSATVPPPVAAAASFLASAACFASDEAALVMDEKRTGGGGIVSVMNRAVLTPQVFATVPLM